MSLQISLGTCHNPRCKRGKGGLPATVKQTAGKRPKLYCSVNCRAEASMARTRATAKMARVEQSSSDVRGIERVSAELAEAMRRVDALKVELRQLLEK